MEHETRLGRERDFVPDIVGPSLCNENKNGERRKL